MKKGTWLMMIVVSGVLAMVFTAGAQDKKEITYPEAAFVAGKCGVCHKIEKVCGQIGNKNPEQWAVTVKRMASKGPGIGEPDQKRVLTFLTTQPDDGQLCPK